MTDGHKYACATQFRRQIRPHVSQTDSGDHLISQDVVHNRVPDKGDLLILERPVLHDLGRPQLIPSVDDRHTGGKLCEERGFFHCAVATADHDQFFASEEIAVAGSTGGHAVAHESGFAGNAELNGRSTRRDNKRLGLDRSLAIDCEAERAASEIHGGDLAGQKFSPEPFGLGPHLFHQFRSHNRMVESRIVFHLSGGGQLAAGLQAFDQQGRQISPRSVNRSGQSSRP